MHTVGQTQSIANTNVIYTYGQIATFILNIDNASEYSEFTIYINSPGSIASSHKIEPSNNVIKYERDLREQPFPPFGLITYWWEFTDSQNDIISVEKTTFQYIDNRYQWQSYTEKKIQVFWISGEKATYIETADIITAALSRMEHAFQTTLSPDVDVYYYPSTSDLQSALQLAGYQWVGGAAYPELGVILSSVSDQQAQSQIQRIIPHELTHKVIYDLYGAEGYNNIPAWLMEGLASYFETNPDPMYALALDEANAQSNLIPLETLCYPFPDDKTIALLSYAQSESLTRYLQQQYGWSTITRLLTLYTKEGVSCLSGLQTALNVESRQVERDWRIWLEKGSSGTDDDMDGRFLNLPPEWIATVSIFMKDAARWLILGFVLFLPLLFFSIQQFIKR